MNEIINYVAEILWKKSVDMAFRYTSVISDEDSKAINHIWEMGFYPGRIIEKQECITHVSKRLRTEKPRNVVTDIDSLASLFEGHQATAASVDCDPSLPWATPKSYSCLIYHSGAEQSTSVRVSL